MNCGDLRQALKEQYRAGLKMLAQCVELCPEDLWLSGKPQREVWRIAFHAAFFTQLYMGQTYEKFEPWPGCHDSDEKLFKAPANMEPYELPADCMPYTRAEILDYISFVTAQVRDIVDKLDLETADSGFPWYKNISKLSHELMNLRHIQGHVGQISELLMMRGIDIDWVGRH